MTENDMKSIVESRRCCNLRSRIVNGEKIQKGINHKKQKVQRVNESFGETVSTSEFPCDREFDHAKDEKS